MATPMKVYRELAVKYGNIDPKDKKAVNKFFESGVYELSDEIRREIINQLFKRDGEKVDIDSFKFEIEDSDEDVPLPKPANYTSLNDKHRKGS